MVLTNDVAAQTKPDDPLTRFYRSLGATYAARPDITLDEERQLFEHWGDCTTEPGDTDYVVVSANGVPGLLCTPHGVDTDRTLLCFHGGGWACGSVYSHRKMYAHLARALGCRALLVDYRRAPEHRYPAPIEDAMTAYRWLLEEGVAPGSIMFAGDSVGGNIAVATVLHLRDRGIRLPAATISISPSFDFAAGGASIAGNESTDVFISGEMVRLVGERYVEPDLFGDPLINPINADLAGLPPAFLLAGGDEVLCSDAERFAEAGGAAGMDVGLLVQAGMQHVPTMLAGATPDGDRAVAAVADWARRRFRD